MGGQVNVSYQSKSDRFTTPENQASRLSLIPPTPLSKGLVIDFFGEFFGKEGEMREFPESPVDEKS